MTERRMSAVIAALIVFLVSVGLWRAFTPSGRRAEPAPGAGARSDTSEPATFPIPRYGTAPQTTRAPQPPPSLSSPLDEGPSYLELVARAATRRRIRLSAGLTYLNDVVAQSEDSMLHRWDNRVQRPVRVFLSPGATATVQPSFLDAVRHAFQRWQDAGVSVRFNVDADSGSAEVYLRWTTQFDIERTGQTDLTWNADGHLISGVVTLAALDPTGQPLRAGDVHVVALHEIGHLIGLDHSSDSADLMYPTTKVRDLSPRDVASALLLYELPPGSLR
ncbi:MAG TPA: matrixin family metalloprotease [Gemmatimonadales bacterium]|nr:matrixin family metalloprotease [Gemmatimonadales bacterium]